MQSTERNTFKIPVKPCLGARISRELAGVETLNMKTWYTTYIRDNTENTYDNNYWEYTTLDGGVRNIRHIQPIRRRGSCNSHAEDAEHILFDVRLYRCVAASSTVPHIELEWEHSVYSFLCICSMRAHSCCWQERSVVNDARYSSHRSLHTRQIYCIN